MPLIVDVDHTSRAWLALQQHDRAWQPWKAQSDSRNERHATTLAANRAGQHESHHTLWPLELPRWQQGQAHHSSGHYAHTACAGRYGQARAEVALELSTATPMLPLVSLDVSAHSRHTVSTMICSATHANDHAGSALLDKINHPDLLAQIFQRLPVGDQCFTISMVSKQWRQWAAEKLAAINAAARKASSHLLGSIPIYHIPGWWVKRVWRDLDVAQQKQLMKRAAYYGDMSTLKFVGRTGCLISYLLSRAAAAGGQLEALRWARSKGAAWDSEVCAHAAMNGHLPVLAWARRNGCPWSEETCRQAALNGHLSVLRWARQHGCAWDKRTCSSAAYSGHLAVLQWVRGQGCPWDKWVCGYAACNGHLEVMQWAWRNGCPCDFQYCVVISRREGHGDVVRWCEEIIAMGA